ncbi:S-adenosyl-L-methionine-dependent methyltransferase [Thozetella sp. PMI_491]|nr:S-adenosyl-L-methionine-dependent methyltransferase [Thozetella sp. PMI_491]
MSASRNPNHEHDARWTAVDAYAFPHSHPASRHNSAALENALAKSKAAGLPDISTSPAQGKFLALACKQAGVTHALEVGTLGGYSAIWVASENPQLRLTTVEYDPKHAEVARKNIEFAGLSDRIEVINGAGLDVLTRLRDEVVAGTRPKFGFVFIDADKENNWNYVELSLAMVKPRTAICVDNVVRRGQVADFSIDNSRIQGARDVIEKAGKDPRLDSVVIQTVGEKSYDGWLWIVVNE